MAKSAGLLRRWRLLNKRYAFAMELQDVQMCIHYSNLRAKIAEWFR